MQQIPPIPPAKKGAEPRNRRSTGGVRSSLFSTGPHPIVGDPDDATRRIDRGARLASDIRRALFFAVVLVAVGIVLYQFVTATGL